MIRLLSVVLLLASLAACSSSESSSSAKTVHVTLDEYSYETSQDTFVVGQVYKFVLENEGKIPHEWVIVPRGAESEGAGIIEVMESELAPGSKVTRTYTFLRPGSYDFACYIPGSPNHYEAGMVHPIEVVSQK